MCIFKNRKNGVRYIAILLAVLSFITVLSACAPVPMVPGGEPFGEQTASNEKAEQTYTALSESFRQEAPETWDGFTISWSKGYTLNAYIYRAEEYTLAYCEEMHNGEYLWYDGWLYWRKGDSAAYREMTWEELQTDMITAELWNRLQIQLTQSPEELTYKYIPMSNDKYNLLTAKFNLGEEQPGDYLSISAPIYSGGTYKNIGFRWQDVGDLEKGVGVDNTSVSVSFYALQDSTDLQAERKVWSFGHDCGLSEEGVPALSRQDEEREWCQDVIASMDFSILREQAAYQEDLTFPEFPSQCFAKQPEETEE